MFYGWWIVFGVFIVQFTMAGFFTYGFPLLVVPVQETFDASREDVMWGMSGAGVLGLLLPPLAGRLVDRWSARGLIIIGTLMLILAFVAMSMSRSVLQFTLCMAILIAIPNTLLGPVTGSTLVSRWFEASRGRALGFAAVGTSAGGLLLPALIQSWLASGGWRGALQNLAWFTVIVVLPIAIFLLRDDPADKGLEPDGGVGPSEANAPIAAGPEWTTLQVLKSLPFWLVSLSLGLLFQAYTSILTNLPAYATDLGVPGERATLLIITIAVSGLIGKIAFGYAVDSIGLRLGLWGAQGFAAVGAFILSFEPDYSVMLLASVLFGLATGGMLPVWGAILAAIFGTTSYGRVMGMTMPIISLLVMPGFVVAGRLRDSTGDYVLVFQLFTGILIFSAALLLPLKVEPATQSE